jgi:uncharacterized OB-fold protein
MSGLAPRAAFDEGLARGELRYQWCPRCAAPVFYPRTLCPGCGDTALQWRTSRGTGTVYSTTTVARRDADGYNVALVDVDEGFRMMSTVLGDPAQVGIGAGGAPDNIPPHGRPVAAFRPGGAA